MEVATIITSEKKIILLFEAFIYSFPAIHFVSKDYDTAFFYKMPDKKDKLYYHFKLDDVEQEFIVNFKEEEVRGVKKYFGEKTIYMFDLSYATETLLTSIFKGFKDYLIQNNKMLIPLVLISHPFYGLKKLGLDY